MTRPSHPHSDPFHLHSKVALLTGGSRGIGAAIAIELAKRGAKVVVNYAHSHEDAQEAVHHIKHHHHGEVVAIKTDVGDPHSLKKLLQATCAHFGHVDIVSSNAELHSVGHFKNVTPEFLAHKAFCHLREKGRIILTASHKGHHKRSVNSACKGAIDGLVQSFVIDCGDKKTTVGAVALGAIKKHNSKEHDPERHHLADEEVEQSPSKGLHPHRLGHAGDVACVVAFPACDAAEWVSGEIIGVDEGALHYDRRSESDHAAYKIL
ncbi:putative hydroxysteroid dehydrogenase [Aspergillus keveii]|uniref:Hydroxysteroid dehydrogenase n=1 Tax=Aspergillus keveii TaxID=714993 RepID=A0ABR4FJA7_9EURO